MRRSTDDPTAVALFASAFHPHLGGVEELVRQLALEYRARGIEAIVVTNRWPRNLPREELVTGIPVFRLPLRAPEGSSTAWATYALTRYVVRRQVAAILVQRRIDVIHVQCVSTNGHYARLAAQDLDVPLIVTTQGERLMDATGAYDRSDFLNQTMRALLRDADGVTACSRDVLRDIQEYAGDPLASRSKVIYNGVSITDFVDPQITPHRHDRPYVFAVGRLVPQKGFDVLIQAFAAAVRATAFGHDLLLAGDGSERAPLDDLVRDLGLAARVHLVGPADRRRVVSLYKGCSYFVLPSRYEPLGIVNLEAMAAGKAIIASRVGGVPEIVADGESGLLVEQGNVDELEEALVQLAGDATLRDRLGDSGRSSVESFTWPRIADEYLDFYRHSRTSRRHVDT